MCENTPIWVHINVWFIRNSVLSSPVSQDITLKYTYKAKYNQSSRTPRKDCNIVSNATCLTTTLLHSRVAVWRLEEEPHIIGSSTILEHGAQN